MSADSSPLKVREVFAVWWPLAASWLLMGLELPAVSAAVARLPEPTVGLAAYGGVVFPLALLIESPVVMLLSASTALSRDVASYAVGRRFMLALGVGFTTLHAVVAFSPLFDVLVRGVLGVPESIVEPARLGFRVMTPWTCSIAYRRFQQGLLIRFGHSPAVGIGTAIRLGTNVAVLAAGLVVRTVPGILVATLAVAAGVVAEAVYAGIRVRPVIRGALRAAPAVDPPLTAAAFLRFYVPLMITPLFVFLTMPLASAAISRMPRPIESLAVWPVVNGFVFTLRSAAFALNEVVVALLDRPRALEALRRFAHFLAGALTAVVVVTAATPLAVLWFGRVSALPAELVRLAVTGLWIAAVVPGLTAYQNLLQGIVVHARRTRGVTESVLVLLAVSVVVLAAGVVAAPGPGLHVALFALSAGTAAMVVWLLRRARETGVRATPVPSARTSHV